MKPAQLVENFFGSLARQVDAGDLVLREWRHAEADAIGWHRHSQPYLTIALDGEYVEHRGGAPNRIRAGAVIVHDTGSESERFFCATRTLKITLLQQERFAELIPGAHTVGCSAGEALRSLVSVWEEQQSRKRVYRAAISLIAELQRNRKEAPDWFIKGIDAVNWAGEEPMPAIAKRIGVNPLRLSRAFHNFLGTTPTAYRMRSRIRIASGLLLESAQPIADIAAACGFSDQSHMTKVFSVMVGITPKRYREEFGILAQ